MPSEIPPPCFSTPASRGVPALAMVFSIPVYFLLGFCLSRNGVSFGAGQGSGASLAEASSRRRILTVNLDLPSFAPPAGSGVPRPAGGGRGSNTVDPALLALPRMDIPPTDILVPALPLPQGDTAPRFAGDATLTQARGGDGNPNGRGAGFGYGSGDGTGTGGAGRAGEARKAQEGAPKEWGVLQKVQAHYPPLALKYRVQGYVVVRVTVDENGVPIKVQPVRGSDLLMPECLRVLALWRFEPPGKYGLGAPVSFPVVYKFEIDT